jgi:hypothetical protein
MYPLLCFTCVLVLLAIPRVAARPTTKWLYEKWVREYKILNGKPPPANYQKWVDLARHRKCIFRPKHYKQIFDDLSQLTLEDFQSYLQLSVADLLIHSPMRIIQSSEFSEELKHPFGNLFQMAAEVIEPSKPFNLIYQSYDEAMILPDDSGNRAPYVNPSEFLQRNKCYNETYSSWKYNHSLILAPTSFIAIPQRLPVFSTSKLYCYLDILAATLNNGRFGTYSLNTVPWEKKENRAVFRGTATGINYKEAMRIGLPLTAAPRYHLYELTKLQKAGKLVFNSSIELDFSIVRQNEGSEIIQSRLNDEYPVGNWMDPSLQFQSKYLVIVDGNSWPDRLSSFLRSGSLVFLSTIQKEYVINQLHPFEHFIPVKPDLSDLLEKLEWAEQHDDEARKIAGQAVEYAKSSLRTQDLQCYNALLMMEYQSRFYEAKESLKKGKVGK